MDRRLAAAPSPTGPVIPLSAVTTLVPTVGALQVNHQGQQPSMTISFASNNVKHWRDRADEARVHAG